MSQEPGFSNEELKPCPMKSSHPYGATEVRELMPDYWMVQCLTAHHHVSVSGYKTKELAIEAWNRRSQEAPVAQVEVYRKALEELIEASKMWSPGCIECNKIAVYCIEDVGNYCEAHVPAEDKEPGNIYQAGFNLIHAIEKAEALLTSKPEPVAPVRKWEAEDEK